MENQSLCQMPRFQTQYKVHEYRHRELAVIYWDGNPTKYQLLDNKLALSQGWNRITKSLIYENQHHQRSFSIIGTVILKSGQQVCCFEDNELVERSSMMGWWKDDGLVEG
jgi:hypothetical protein